MDLLKRHPEANALLFGATLALVTACGGLVADPPAPLELGQASQRLLSADVYGSDTLFEAITEAFAVAPLSSPLVYRGTGSGNGERCLRGLAPPDACAAEIPVQAIAPMSRAINTPREGEVSTPIAIDGIAIVASSTLTDPAFALSDVLTAFCGADGLGQDGEASCGAANRVAGAKFRRDQASGTTEVFQQRSGCTAFCADVQIVADSAAGPVIGDAVPAACAATDTATTCIGKLVAADPGALGYSGRSVLEVAGTQALSVGGVPFTDDTLRALVADPANAYRFARFVFLNANLNNLIGSGSVQEEFYQWALTDDPAAFEGILVDNDFLACSSAAPLNCVAPPAPPVEPPPSTEPATEPASPADSAAAG